MISDQSARSIFARCQALVTGCDTDKQLTVKPYVVFEIKGITWHLWLYCEDINKLTWPLGDIKFLVSC